MFSCREAVRKACRPAVLALAFVAMGASCLRAVGLPRRRPHGHRQGTESLGHRCAPRLQGPAQGLGLGGQGSGCLGGQVRFLPRCLRRSQRGVLTARGRHHERRHQDRPRGAPERRHVPGPHDADEGLDGVDAVGLHQPRDALDGTEVAEHGRGLRRHRLPAQHGRHLARQLRALRHHHRRSPAAAAQPQRHHHRARPVARQGHWATAANPT